VTPSTVLVTGAGGFVGSALCARLAERGYLVRATTRSAAQGSRPLSVHGIVIGDIGPQTDWTSAVEGADAVVHLAARVHMLRDTATHPLAEYHRVNVDGTRSLALAASRAGVRRFIFLSSAKVHGERSVRPFQSDDRPAPADAYAVSKLAAEMELQQTLAGSATQWTIVRAPLVYGPGVRANFLRLMSAVMRGVPLPLGAIENRRSLIYLGNLVDALQACIERPRAEGRTFLVSDGEDLSTPELVRRLGTALGRPARLLPVPVALLRIAGFLTGKSAALNRLVDSLQVDSAAIRNALNWAPPYSVDQGLGETARWYSLSGA
jgi:UDP-N-acetyl-alpha-D-quinovosamine dehydrogenase